MASRYKITIHSTDEGDADDHSNVAATISVEDDTLAGSLIYSLRAMEPFIVGSLLDTLATVISEMNEMGYLKHDAAEEDAFVRAAYQLVNRK